MNYANSNRPSVFSEYLSQNGAVNYIKSVIADNTHPNGIIINGKPGTGKTTLAQLYTKATLCLNREVGESEACGSCDVCKNNQHPNITYYRITEASSFKDVVGDLISISKSAPAVMTEEVRSDNYRRFIIIDELQNATRQSISPFLDSLEFASEDTTVILISMDLDKLDPIVKDAIESRCIELSLDTLPVKAIADKIQDKHPKAEYKALILIAKLALGNMRKAWSLFEYFITQVSEEEITADLVYTQKYGGLNKERRESFLQSLQNNSWQDTKELLKEFNSKANDVIIAKTLLEELLVLDLNPKGVELISALSLWLQSNYKIPLEAVFIQFEGHTLESNTEKVEEEDKRIVVEKVQGLPLEATPAALREATSDILNQFKNITGKEVVVEENVVEEVETPACLTLKSWEELLKLYDKYN